jgi:hypothetical protein
MRNRSLWSILCTCPLLFVTSCLNDPSLTSIVITPSSYTAQLAPCGDPQVTTNFTATGYYTRPNHAAVTKDITDQVTWTSLTPAMVTVSSTGTATVTCQMWGSTQISASAKGFHGDIVGYGTFNVTQESGTLSTDVISIAITPANPTVASGATQAFVATGTTAGGSKVTITTSSVWSSQNTGVATINTSTGVATGVSAGTSAIGVLYTNSDATQVSATTNLTVQ